MHHRRLVLSAVTGIVQHVREEITLVAAHAWDIHGAHQAGLVTGWVSRLEGRFPPVFAPPDVTGAGLLEVVEALLALRPA